MIKFFPELKLSQGLFRLWIVMSTLWIVVTVAVFTPAIFEQMRYKNLAEKAPSYLTKSEIIEIDALRRNRDCRSVLSSFELNYTDEQIALARSNLVSFECSTKSLVQISFSLLCVLIGVPLIVLIIGTIVIRALSWIVRGFIN